MKIPPGKILPFLRIILGTFLPLSPKYVLRSHLVNPWHRTWFPLLVEYVVSHLILCKFKFGNSSSSSRLVSQWQIIINIIITFPPKPFIAGIKVCDAPGMCVGRKKQRCRLRRLDLAAEKLRLMILRNRFNYHKFDYLINGT